MRRNWETDPLLCLKFSTWAGLKHLWDFITDTLTRSRFYRWVQNQTASGVFGAKGSFELKQFNTTHCHIVRCQHRETRFWEFPTFQSSLAKGRCWGSPKRALVWELESHYLGFRQKSTFFLGGFWGSLILTSLYPFRRHHKFPLARSRRICVWCFQGL